MPEPDRAERLARGGARAGPCCPWCRRECGGLVRATTDHLIPRVKGGPSWVENEVLACARCNRARGHRSPADWLEECRRRRWGPHGRTVLGVLQALDRAIAERGGQRRARPYLAAQLRRLSAEAAPRRS